MPINFMPINIKLIKINKHMLSYNRDAYVMDELNINNLNVIMNKQFHIINNKQNYTCIQIIKSN